MIVRVELCSALFCVVVGAATLLLAGLSAFDAGKVSFCMPALREASCARLVATTAMWLWGMPDAFYKVLRFARSV
ncbi:hypothetical protein HK26_00680 [Acetobacter okinawensis]|uniref:Uncharacterized protein n=1 Tax=Acetobacter okinawensis TaxID=1076594 RepID=A0A252BZC8_9PROT|nr:hypothetical protein HK26_00680 [Acetobacter okinawensis]